mgnify:CR=1 FL=1
MAQPVLLNVRGQATAEVPPDYAWMVIEVSASDADRSVALRRTERDAAGLRSVLEGAVGVRRLVLTRVRVHEETRWNQATGTHDHLGWRAHVSGRLEVDVDRVAGVAEAVVAAHASIGGMSWFLDENNPAYREVRRAAVADAFRAAADFADALHRDLGPLRTLADPGLLGGDGRDDRPVGRAMMAGVAMDAGPPEFEYDPEPQTVSAAVEATFEVT